MIASRRGKIGTTRLSARRIEPGQRSIRSIALVRSNGVAAPSIDLNKSARWAPRPRGPLINYLSNRITEISKVSAKIASRQPSRHRPFQAPRLALAGYQHPQMPLPCPQLRLERNPGHSLQQDCLTTETVKRFRLSPVATHGSCIAFHQTCGCLIRVIQRTRGANHARPQKPFGPPSRSGRRAP
jgi:hypothetical protein